MSFYSILFPQGLNCIRCNMPISRNNKYSLCKRCYEDLYFINESCEICGKPILNYNDEEIYIDKCPFCSKKYFLFDKNISAIEYDENSKSIIFDLKYKNKTYLSKIIAEIMAESFIKRYWNILEQIDIITYVPLSDSRMKNRGFNQSEKICKYFIEEIDKKTNGKLFNNIKQMDILDRKVNTKRLHELKEKRRKKELKGTFSLKEDFYLIIKGKNIAVIDDIFTTGATMNEISKVLKISGASRVYSLTFLTGRYEK